MRASLASPLALSVTWKCGLWLSNLFLGTGMTTRIPPEIRRVQMTPSKLAKSELDAEEKLGAVGGRCTVGQNQIVLRHRIIHIPTSSGVSEVSERASERSGVRERSKQGGARI